MTQKPWQIEEATCVNGGGFKYITDGEGNDVCDLYSRSGEGVKIRGHEFPNADEHAHLIAAAPDLLEALEALKKHYIDHPILPKGFKSAEAFSAAILTRNEFLDAADAAIAKARPS